MKLCQEDHQKAECPSLKPTILVPFITTNCTSDGARPQAEGMISLSPLGIEYYDERPLVSSSSKTFWPYSA